MRMSPGYPPAAPAMHPSWHPLGPRVWGYRAGSGQARGVGRAERRRGMRALTWQGKRSVTVETVPDPKVEAPNDAVIRVTSTAICGSDLHLYEVLGPFLTQGDVLGHETMGVVEEVVPEAGELQVGDR